jgi:hypothetical protein
MIGFARATAARALMLLALTGLGLALGACSKCDVPDWFNTAPHVCHSAPQP